MGWQKTFTLSKRSKGCHLITDEIMAHIRPGLQDVQVRSRLLPGYLDLTRTGFMPQFTGGNAVSVHVSSQPVAR